MDNRRKYERPVMRVVLMRQQSAILTASDPAARGYQDIFEEIRTIGIMKIK